MSHFSATTFVGKRGALLLRNTWREKFPPKSSSAFTSFTLSPSFPFCGFHSSSLLRLPFRPPPPEEAQPTVPHLSPNRPPERRPVTHAHLIDFVDTPFSYPSHFLCPSCRFLSVFCTACKRQSRVWRDCSLVTADIAIGNSLVASLCGGTSPAASAGSASLAADTQATKRAHGAALRTKRKKKHNQAPSRRQRQEQGIFLSLCSAQPSVITG